MRSATLVGLLAFIMATFVTCKPKGAKEKTLDEVAFDICKKAATARLKAPSTAKFGSFSESSVEKTMEKDNRYYIRSFVDAQNPFGAMLRNKYECVADYNGNQEWAIVRVNFITN